MKTENQPTMGRKAAKLEGEDAVPPPPGTAGEGTGAGSAAEIFAIFLRLGLTSFGGPVAHLGYFREEFVLRRRWFGERNYADLVALCQFLPGPASSQVGIGIGLWRGGLPGAFAAFAGFTLPSALALIAFAYGVLALGDIAEAGWLQGFKVAAVAVVAQAVWGMGRSLAPDRLRASFALAAAVLVSLWSGPGGQVSAILLGGVLGIAAFRPPEKGKDDGEGLTIDLDRRFALTCLFAFFSLLILLPIAAGASGSYALELFDSFYRAGALVFGGGHVVLPLLQAEVVPSGWVSADSFLAGYGAAQAVPGPLFTFSAFLGTVAGGFWAAGVALAAIFAPSFLLLFGVLPFWEALRHRRLMRAGLTGVNAAVVGLLLAALYDPVWTSGILSPAHFALGLIAFAALAFWKAPAWAVVIAAGLLGAVAL